MSFKKCFLRKTYVKRKAINSPLIAKRDAYFDLFA